MPDPRKQPVMRKTSEIKAKAKAEQDAKTQARQREKTAVESDKGTRHQGTKKFKSIRKGLRKIRRIRRLFGG